MRQEKITIYTRKLNRTLLKKTGTKNAYITDKKLLAFFDYYDINELITTQNESNRIIFHLKNNLYQSKSIFSDTDFIEMHIVRGVNTEVRLSGADFSNMLDRNGITETDSIIIEKVKKENEKPCYYMSFSISENTIVLQNLNNMENKYWAWDNTNNIEMWNDVAFFNAYIYKNEIMNKKKLRFRYLGNIFIEMAARERSQEKKIFAIEEYFDGKWIPLSDFRNFKTLELNRNAQELTIYKRDKIPSKITECEVQV